MARIYLGMPAYGNPEPGACQAFYELATRHHSVKTVAMRGSLLANTFNRLWCDAVNGGYQFFAMLHGDVIPEVHWLDKLYEILQARDDDVVSTVIPIKTGQGVTSTAIDNPHNPWKPLFRVTMRELATLPETFTNVDLGYPDNALLVNTGCWIARLKTPWARKVLFTIRDAIGERADGTLVPLVASEDWELSRQLHRLGVKYSATKAVKVKHRGEQEYPNWGTWGTVRSERNG